MKFKRIAALLLVMLTCFYALPVASGAAYSEGYYQVTATTLNVRESAGTGYSIVDTLSNGTLITVTEISGNWGKITTADNITGWVSLSYCNRLYYISFDANGGTTVPEPMLITAGDSVAVPSEVPVNSGLTFRGWSTSLANAESGIVSYSANGALGGSAYITPNSDLVLYACWTEKTVTDTGSTITPVLDGETSRTVKILYDGVTSTNITTSSSSKYELQNFNVIEFDLSQTDLYIDVTNTRTYANQLKTTLNTVTSFNSSNDEGKTAVAAINGDLWMTTYAHSRVEGSGTSYGGYSDAVVTSGLTLPRGFNVYDGEIICSAYMQQETPYEGEFWSFGITEDYIPLIGCPELEITVTDTTKGVTASADGLNRLPANNALVVYSDKGCLNNYALSDAYEVVIDCDYDYTVEHGAKITGKVVGIYSSDSSSDPVMAENRIILTARGTSTGLIGGFALGDTVTLDFMVTERYGRNTEGWQNVTNAVGGHMPFVVDGVKRETGTTNNYPTTIVGIKNDGSVCFIVNDGRQSSFSTGLDFNMYWDLADDFDLNTAFILDGGGSTTLVELADSGYNVVNSPSDGRSRSVVNSVILSVGPERSEQGDFDVKYPDPDVDLTALHFATDEDYSLIAGLNESISEQTVNGALLTVKDFYSAPGVVISYGLPNTSSYNPNSVLADITYPSIKASDYPYVVFDMSVVSADSSLVQFQTLYTTTGARKGISQDTFIGFNNAYNNNGYSLYTLNPGSNSTYTGMLNTFHFGFFFPANGVTAKDGDYVILRSVRLAKTANEAAAMTALSASTLNFNANGGTVNRSLKYVLNGRTYGELPVPAREGFDFEGWYTSASGGTLVTEDTVTSHIGIKTLYAHWSSGHTHTWSEWEITVAPTCVISGEQTRKCTICGGTETAEVPATGEHLFGDWVIITPARCEVVGEERRFCEDCDEYQTREIPSAGHVWGEWSVTALAGCEIAGEERKFCANCDEYQVRVIEPLGHVWGEWIVTKAPTADSDGTEIRYCDNCDATENRIVSDSGCEHVWSDWIETVAPTCAEEGSETRHCKNCGESENRNIPVNTEHTWGEWVVTAEPTCVSEGVETKICSVCRTTETQSVAATGEHTWGEWFVSVDPTLSAEGEKTRICSVCNEKESEKVDKLVNPFTDVKEGKWYTDGILYCYYNGYMAGMSETVFGYKETVTRAMFATILAKIDGAELSEYTSAPFGDVADGKWYTAAIAWAAENEYAAGIGGGLYGYKDPVTREQLATFFYVYSGKNGISVTRRADITGFDDYGRIHEYALEAVSWAVKVGLISGTSDTTLSPRDSATRAEIALIIKNYVENVKNKEITVAGTDSGLTRDGTPKKYFTLSFDDGITQDSHIIEILKKYDVDCCTFNINTGLYGVSWPEVGVSLGRPDVTHIRYTEEELMTGIYDGYDVEVHTLNHPALGNYDNDPDSIINEVAGDASNIEAITGYTPIGMAWPGGDAFYTDTTIDIIMENTDIRFARGTTSTFGFKLPEYFMKWMPTCSVSDPLLLEYARTFINAPCNEDMLFYVWGHGYELDFYDSYDTFEKLIKMISEADNIVLVTNAEFYQLFKDEIPSWK